MGFSHWLVPHLTFFIFNAMPPSFPLQLFGLFRMLFYSICLSSCFFMFFLKSVSVHGQDVQDSSVYSEVSAPSNLGLWGISVRDMETGKELVGLNQGLSLTPASVQKLLTTAAAFSILGADFQFSTQFSLRQSGRDWFLLVEGGWDPSLGTNLFTGFDQKTLFDSLQHFLLKNNIHRISGIYALHHGRQQDIIPDSWPWVDLGNYFGASVSRLSYNQNRVKLSFCTEDPGLSATLIEVSPVQAGVSWESYVVSGPQSSGDNAFIYAGLYQAQRQIVGSLPPNEGSIAIQGSIAFPALTALEQLRMGLQLRGIECAKAVGWAPEELAAQVSAGSWDWKSVPLMRMASHINQYSNNFMAEHLLVAVGQGDYFAGRDSVRAWLKGQCADAGLFYDDGSGLSRSNGISTSNLTGLLSRWTRASWFSSWLSTLAVSGESGTLSGFTTSKLKQAFAGKSGSIGQVKTYAGYLRCTSGKRVAVAVFVNSVPGSLRSVVPAILNSLEGIQSQY